MSILGNRIKKEREKLELTREELAQEIGVSYSAIAMYEQGNREPNNELLLKMCQLFNCSMDYLMGKSYYKNYDEFERIDKLVLNYPSSPKETKIICDTLNYINKYPNVSLGEAINKFTDGLPVDETEILKSIIRHIHYRYHGKLPQSNMKNNSVSINKIPILRHRKSWIRLVSRRKCNWIYNR